MKNYYWGVLWRADNKLDGYREHLCWDWMDHGRTGPKLFRTRQEARVWRQDRYNYIRIREDLRAEPHGWKFPAIVKVFPRYDYAVTR